MPPITPPGSPAELECAQIARAVMKNSYATVESTWNAGNTSAGMWSTVWCCRWSLPFNLFEMRERKRVAYYSIWCCSVLTDLKNKPRLFPPVSPHRSVSAQQHVEMCKDMVPFSFAFPLYVTTLVLCTLLSFIAPIKGVKLKLWQSSCRNPGFQDSARRLVSHWPQFFLFLAHCNYFVFPASYCPIQ